MTELCDACHYKLYPATYSPERQVIGLITLVVQALLVIASAVLVYSRRNFYPLSGRSIPLLFVSLLGSLGSVYTPLVEAFGEAFVACDLAIFLGVTPIPLFGGSLLLRVARLEMKQKVQNKLQQILGDGALGTDEMFAEIKRLQRRTSNSWLLLAELGFFAPAVLFVLYSFAMNPKYGRGYVGCSMEGFELAMLLLYSALWFIGAVISLRKLRRLHDGFKLQAELSMFYKIMVPLCIIYLVLKMIPDVSLTFSPSYMPWLILNSGLIITLVWPALDTFREERRAAARRYKVASSMEVDHTLEAVLLNPVGAALFEKHLQREFSAENLMFHREVAAFRALHATDDNAAARMATAMYDKYMSDHAPLQLNLPEGVAPVVRRAIDEGVVPLAIFDRADEETYKLMSQDSFSRFRKGPVYARYLATLNDDSLVSTSMTMSLRLHTRETPPVASPAVTSSGGPLTTAAVVPIDDVELGHGDDKRPDSPKSTSSSATRDT